MAIEPKDKHTENFDSREKPSNPPEAKETRKEKKPEKAGELTDEEYWEEMLFISLGPGGWNIGCGCG